jgi:hypothetical protein
MPDRAKSKSSSGSPDPDHPFRCSVCSKRFTRQVSLRTYKITVPAIVLSRGAENQALWPMLLSRKTSNAMPNFTRARPAHPRSSARPARRRSLGKTCTGDTSRTSTLSSYQA